MMKVCFLSQDWQEIVKLYEKDNVNLGNQIVILLRSLAVSQKLCLLYTVVMVSLFIHFSQYKFSLKHQFAKYIKWRMITEF